jgi:hypothetical protein
MPRHSLLLIATLSAALAGCGSNNPAPETVKQEDKPVDNDHNQLRDAIQKPLDRAKAVDDNVEKAKEQQDKDIDKQTNGG